MFQKLDKIKKTTEIPLIIDIGNFSTKAGHAGNNQPDYFEQTTKIVYTDSNNKKKIFSKNPLFYPNLKNMINPYLINVEKENYKNKENLELFYDHIFEELFYEPEKGVLFLVENPNDDLTKKKKQVELIFEKYQSKGLYFKNNASLASFLHNKRNSIILDIGGYNTFITSIEDGFIINKSLHQNFGGETMTEIFYNKLKNDNMLNLFNFSFTKRNNFCNLPKDIKKFAILSCIRDVKENCFKVSQNQFNPNIKFNFADNTVYELPDKTNLVIGKEENSVPELIFKTTEEKKGITELLFKAIDLIDLDKRKDIMSNIIITGGTTNTKHFFERLQKEINQSQKNELFFNYKTKFYFCTNKLEKQNSSWLSASTIGTMDYFKELIIEKEEYEEHGISLIERKLM